MATRIEHFTITAPNGTARAAPLEVPILFAPGEPVGLQIVIPDGHAGLTGIALAAAHQPIIPFTTGQFLTGNDEEPRWALEGYPNSGQWSAFVYNTDIFDHQFFVRLELEEVGMLVPSVIGLPEAPPTVDQVPTGDLGVPTDRPPVDQPPVEEPPPVDQPPVEPPPDDTPPVEPPLPPEEPLPEDVPLPPDVPPDDGTTDGTTDGTAPGGKSPREAQLEAMVAKLQEELRHLRKWLADANAELRAHHLPQVHPSQTAPGTGGVAVPPGYHPPPPKPHRAPPRPHGHPPSAHHPSIANIHVPYVIAGHPEVKPACAHIVNIIRHVWPRLQITSTTSGGHVPGSYHYLGEAVDLHADQAYMDEAARWIARELTPELTEGIHNPGLAVKNGHAVDGPAFYSAVWAGHRNHIHVARAEPGRAKIAGLGPPALTPPAPAHHDDHPRNTALHRHETDHAAVHPSVRPKAPERPPGRPREAPRPTPRRPPPRRHR